MPNSIRIYMKKIINVIFPIVFLACVTTPALSLSIQASPNQNGTIDLQAAHEWQWSSGLFSGATLAITNPLNIQEDASSYIATSGRGLDGSIDILGIRFGKKISFGVAFNFQYSSSSIKEVGYVDASDSKRYFIVNDRNIDLILPRIKLDLATHNKFLNFSLTGEAAPWLGVFFDQALYIDDSGTLDPTTLSSFGSGMGAFSATMRISASTSFIKPEVEAIIDYIPVAYDYLDYTLSSAHLDSTIINFRLMGGLTLTALNAAGSAPRIMVGYEWNKVKDNSSDTWVIDTGEMKFAFSLAM